MATPQKRSSGAMKKVAVSRRIKPGTPKVPNFGAKQKPSRPQRKGSGGPGGVRYN
jgi:hypothetical protein